MATKKARGIKRTCQNSDCGVRFYDLERDPIICPICGTEYVVAHAPQSVAKEEEPKPEPAPAPADTENEEETAPEDELVDAEADAVVADDDNNDDTFLEEDEEDGGDVSGLIGGDKPKASDES